MVKNLFTCQCRRCRFDPWITKMPQRRKWLPTPVFLPREVHGQRNRATVQRVARLSDEHPRFTFWKLEADGLGWQPQASPHISHPHGGHRRRGQTVACPLVRHQICCSNQDGPVAPDAGHRRRWCRSDHGVRLLVTVGLGAPEERRWASEPAGARRGADPRTGCAQEEASPHQAREAREGAGCPRPPLCIRPR